MQTPSNVKKSRPSIVLACGATIETALLPYYATHLLAHYDLEVRFALTKESKSFVRRIVLKTLSKNTVYYKNKQIDSETNLPLHKVFAGADLVVVYPATPRILVEACNGAITCPVTRTIAFAPAERVLICPTIHPDLNSSIYAPTLKKLIDRNFTVIGNDAGVTSWAQVELAIETMLSLPRAENPNWRFNASSS